MVVSPAAGRRATRLILPLAAALLALPLATAAHQARPAPYGDRLTVDAPASAAGPAADRMPPRLVPSGHAVRAYAPATGALRWTYTRAGHRPLATHSAPGHAVVLWSDGMVTDVGRLPGRAVRWHRAIPEAAGWLRTPAARRGAGVLQPLDGRTRMLAVVTPRRIAAYRTADGDLRWVLPARPGCAFEPYRHARRAAALLVAQPCAGRGGEGEPVPWSAQLVAIDAFGRIVPHRTPLGNAIGDRPEKLVARHR